MPVPFERFRLLNETAENPRKVFNMSECEVEVQFDDSPPTPLNPGDECPIPEGTSEVGARRINEEDPAAQVFITFFC